MTEEERVRKELIDRINKGGINRRTSSNALGNTSNGGTSSGGTSSSAISNYSSDTPFTDANWDNLNTTDQALQNAMNYKSTEYMASHKYQYEINSLKEAGINPILAPSLGGNSISTPSFSNSSAESSERNATSILSTAMSILAMVVLKKL